jgi:predicted nuclease of restriction endonuclease-like (RecB) superfamily
VKKSPCKKAVAVTKPASPSREDALFVRVVDIIEAARGHISRSVNTAMVQAYWLIGREIVEVEQHGEKRAGYGERMVEGLAKRLAGRVGRGFSVPNLRNMRQFYLTYCEGSALPEALGGGANHAEKRWSLPSVSASSKIRSAVPSESRGGNRTAALIESVGMPAPFPPYLGWTHYLILMRVANPAARAFYEIEAAREGWSSRELERQIASLLFERLAKSRDKEKVLTLARRGHELERPADVLKDPFVLEFLGLDERSHWRERDLEQAIIDRIEGFLLELGKGFCFVARQKRVTLEGDHFYVDLVFYNRLLRSFVLVDLKLGKLTHQDLGQMQMYVNFFDRFQRAEHEAKTIGIVLCSEKNDAMAKITLPENNEQILTACYQMYLPTEEELRAELAREREAAERSLRLAANVKGQDDGKG